MNVINYFNPFSERFHALDDFKKLTALQKIGTIVVTAFASLGLGVCGVATFRAMVEKFTFEVKDIREESEDGLPARVDELAASLLASNEEEESIEESEESVVGSEAGDRSWEESEDSRAASVSAEEDLSAESLDGDGAEASYIVPEELGVSINQLQAIALGQSIQPWDSYGQSLYNQASNFFGALFSGFTRPNAPSEDDKKVEWLRETLYSALNTCSKYIETAAHNKLDAKAVLPSLRVFRDGLINASIGMRQVKEQFIARGNEEGAAALEALLDEGDLMLGALPKENSPPDYLKRLYGAVNQSHQIDHISWKVHKYEKQIKDLVAIFESSFPFVKQSASLDSSWAFIRPPEEAVTALYTGLKNLELGDDDTRYDQKYLDSLRKGYNEGFLLKFRHALKEENENTYLLQLAEMLFTSIDLRDESAFTLNAFDTMGATMLGDNSDQFPVVEGEHVFVSRIKTLYQRLSAAPYGAKAPLLNQWGNSARGQWNINFDPYLQGNPVHVLYQLRIGEKEVKALGMGTPTKEAWLASAELTEEFSGFIRSYKAQGKKHLYINNQNMVPKTGFLSYFLNGDETKRCNLIIGAQKEEGMKGALYAISLSKNTKFYAQSGHYKQLNNAEEFKDVLYQEVFTKDSKVSGCYIPASIKEQIVEFDAKAKNILQQIQHNVFADKEELTVEERRIFIELFYDQLTKMLITELDVDSFNVSCKDAIDRGAGSNAQLFASCALASGQISADQQKTIEMLMLVRALFVRKRPPIHERVERFTEGYAFSLGNSEKIKNLHQALFPQKEFIPL